MVTRATPPLPQPSPREFHVKTKALPDTVPDEYRLEPHGTLRYDWRRTDG
jgi:hypothetical protein